MLKLLRNALSPARIALNWKRHIWNDWFATWFSPKVKMATPYGFSLLTKRFTANLMMGEGTFETLECQEMKEQITRAEVFVDVGANIGFYSCLARSLERRVVAFEPQAQNLECFLPNLHGIEGPAVEVIPLGLSASPGLVPLYGASGPSASLIKGWAGYSSSYRTLIPVNTLDAMLGQRFVGQRLFIKIDVEGAEYQVLQGATAILRNLRPRPVWFVEITLSQFHPGGCNSHFEATFDLFFQGGYAAFLLDAKRTRVHPQDVREWAQAGKTPFPEFNYLFFPEG